MGLWKRVLAWLEFFPPAKTELEIKRTIANELALRRAEARENDDLAAYEASRIDRLNDDDLGWPSGTIPLIDELNPVRPFKVWSPYEESLFSANDLKPLKAPRKRSKAKTPKKASPVAKKAQKRSQKAPVKPSKVPKGKARVTKTKKR